MNHRAFIPTLVGLLLVGAFTEPVNAQEAEPARRPQYEFEKIIIPGAHAEEPIRPQYSLAAALDYVEQGTRAWAQERNCVSCHTTGSYLLTRPALTKVAGKPSEEMRTFFVQQLKELEKTDREEMRKGFKPTQLAYLAAGLAEWDLHVTRELSPETDAALRLMFEVQSDDGSFSNVDCWPPLESDSFHGSTVAALAVASAPGWLKAVAAGSPELQRKQERLTAYLRQTQPPHDYGSTLLLWVAARVPNLIDAERKQMIQEMIWKHQQSDGGWSLRSFAAPEAWGGGNRAKKLRSEPEFNTPPSDGHMTGLAVLVLRAAGIPKSDPRIERAVHWIQSNQRESGRWWTRSLNTDKYHFITYSGTCYPLLALETCDALQ